MKKAIKLLTILVLLTFGGLFTSIAQDGPCPPGGCDDEDPSEEIPFDGGASLLLAAGIGIGGKKIYESYKNKK